MAFVCDIDEQCNRYIPQLRNNQEILDYHGNRGALFSVIKFRILDFNAGGRHKEFTRAMFF